MISLCDLIKNPEKPLTSQQIQLLKQWLEEDWEAADMDRGMLTLVKLLLKNIELCPQQPNVDGELPKAKYAVLAAPPKSDTYVDMKPRLQMYSNGEVAYYKNKKDADAQAYACTSTNNKWIYTVVEINGDE